MRLKLLIAYARKDTSLMQKIVKGFEPLQQQGVLDVLSDEIIHEQQEPNKILVRDASIILLLVSPDFLNADYCYSFTIKEKIERHKQRDRMRVIPVILRPVYWQATPFSNLPVVPYNAKPISTWPNQKNALSEVITTVDKIIKSLDSFSSYSSPWPGMDERSVIEEMIRDRHSKHWEECRTVVKRRVYLRAKDISTNRLEEIIQEVMVKIVRYLPGFHFHCAFKTWLSFIIESCIIDVHRNVQNEGQFVAHSDNALNGSDYESDFSEVWSAEEIFIVREELRNTTAALLEYTTMHSHAARDQLILRMVIFEGKTHTETAKVTGSSASVVSYVVREAQKYVREKTRIDHS